MNYQKIYDSIITKARNTIYDEYTEKHHIIPKCLNGSNSNDNLVIVSARQHFILHALLCKIHPESKKILFAFWAMLNKQSNKKQKREYKVNSRLYQNLRNKAIQEISKNNKGKTGLKGDKNPRFGKLGIGSKAVISFPDKFIFANTRLAGMYYGINPKKIRRCCRNKDFTLNKKGFLFLSYYKTNNLEEIYNMPIIFLRKWIINLEDNKVFENSLKLKNNIDCYNMIERVCKNKKGTVRGKHYLYYLDFINIIFTDNYKNSKDILINFYKKKSYELKSIYCVENNEFYDSYYKAAIENNCSEKYIKRCCKSFYNTTVKGLHFVLKEDLDKYGLQSVKLAIERNGDGQGHTLQCEQTGEIICSFKKLSELYNISRKRVRYLCYNYLPFPDMKTWIFIRKIRDWKTNGKY